MCRNIRCDGFFAFTEFMGWELNRALEDWEYSLFTFCFHPFRSMLSFVPVDLDGTPNMTVTAFSPN